MRSPPAREIPEKTRNINHIDETFFLKNRLLQNNTDVAIDVPSLVFSNISTYSPAAAPKYQSPGSRRGGSLQTASQMKSVLAAEGEEVAVPFLSDAVVGVAALANAE